ncbi:MAG: hypothetical protein QS721_01955 [Candidatus Endonucleobacter sp. (ex Gigantidas childressi)]|nr:hypothetical protein [Candidatus Endonucleobacter sp. (ex Gigantidas childressi)]
MQKSFTTQPKLFVSASDLNHPILGFRMIACLLASTCYFWRQ